ncbi:aminoacyl tRNA synthase complex-interacting multifunctional protein 1-like [Hippocampus comes]|uniref:aminoacyl tRNA synthase complex-interacting multifunctional protein 1-like n=1 Tax=Hippocampus comes TaxID=109280 RepID=UPI00094EA045|nr:PREDICTED: aminoacyl tRNA synthase complex-interacting multifunctional protein 1-like [Hippocampus comes]
MESDNMFHPSLSAALMKLDPEDGGKMVEYFQTHALLAREKALLQASVREQKKLLVENGKLKKDIEELRHELRDKQRRRVAKALVSPSRAANPAASPAPAASPSRSVDLQATGRQRGEKTAAPEALLPPPPAAPAVDVSRLDLRVGRILGVRRHPRAASLTVHDVDVGEKAPRPVVGKRRPGDQQPLAGSLAVLLCNVKACKVRGAASQARLLRCFRSDGPVELLAPPAGSNPGDRVTFLNYPGEPDRELKAKQRVWDHVQPGLLVDAEGVANYKGCGFQVEGKGLCRAPSITNGTIRCT